MIVGIIGSGQLGWMMILEGKRLGHQFYVIDKDNSGPASAIADKFFSIDDYKNFVMQCDVVTYEFESVDETVVYYAHEHDKLKPSLNAIELKWDRSKEMDFFKNNNLPIPEYYIADNLSDVKKYVKNFDKAVIKSAYGGYDGKGLIYYLNDYDLNQLNLNSKYIVEEFIDYDAEASIIGSRSSNGEIVTHEPSFNFNKAGVLIYNYAPFDDYGMADILKKIMINLDYIGVLSVEFFIKNGKPIINEIAPRVHNSGHHTLHGSSISQFEQHIRCITDYPVKKPELYLPGGIVNVLGKSLDIESIKEILNIDNTKLYWYGKKEIRKHRKLGHVNIASETVTAVKGHIDHIMNIIYKDKIEDYI